MPPRFRREGRWWRNRDALLEFDTDFGFVAPDDFANPRRLLRHCEVKFGREPICSLDLKTCANLGEISDRTRNRMRSEKDRSGFQHPRTWPISFFVHGFANEYRTPEPKN